LKGKIIFWDDDTKEGKITLTSLSHMINFASKHCSGFYPTLGTIVSVLVN